jgi:hypothetical protein
MDQIVKEVVTRGIVRKSGHYGTPRTFRTSDPRPIAESEEVLIRVQGIDAGDDHYLVSIDGAPRERVSRNKKTLRQVVEEILDDFEAT